MQERIQLTITAQVDGNVSMSCVPAQVNIDTLITLLGGALQTALRAIPSDSARDTARDVLIAGLKAGG